MSIFVTFRDDGKIESVSVETAGELADVLRVVRDDFDGGETQPVDDLSWLFGDAVTTPELQVNARGKISRSQFLASVDEMLNDLK